MPLNIVMTLQIAIVKYNRHIMQINHITSQHLKIINYNYFHFNEEAKSLQILSFISVIK